MLSSWLDHHLTTWSFRRHRSNATAASASHHASGALRHDLSCGDHHGHSYSLGALATRTVHTPVGPVQLYDSGGDKPCVLLSPDGPNVIAHYAPLIAHLQAHCRVVCFDMPGFGFSLPQADYTHSLDQGAQAIIGVLDSLGIAQAALAMSCANGFYALRAAQRAPERISQLVLSQTPSLQAMHAWVDRTIPKPLRIPVVGQLAAWLFRHKAARSWYRIALPKAAQPRDTPHTFALTAARALDHGGCFCLASVVQGLGREMHDALQGVDTPCTLVWGTLDRSHRHTSAQSLRSCVPHARIVQFDDCGHFPDIEQAERFAQLLLQTLMPQNAASQYATAQLH
jgi:pimeloyl-ACP methyl ester carboxylesterase